MKKILYIVMILLSATYVGCKKADQLVYTDQARVQLSDTATLSQTFVYEPVTVSRDTVYIRVNTIGKVENFDRAVQLVQVPDGPVEKTAKPGIHYVALDDPSLKALMVIKANEVFAMIPVVLLRDTSLKTKTYRLRLQLAGNEEFGLGETTLRTRAIQFSDRLERFFSWRFDTTVASAFNTFGKYSTRKHQFMIDVLGQQIDEAWYQAAVIAGATGHYKNVAKDALNTFNLNPVNIASGAAPMRETNLPSSPLVTFPN
jgi:hypothetical protein